MNPELAKQFRRHNRKNPTAAETTLWKLLKGKQLQGRKFRRQHSFDKYIVDFYCFSEKLVIELDGRDHLGQKRDDQIREEYLTSLGLIVLRFPNKMIFEDLEQILKTITENFRDLQP